MTIDERRIIGILFALQMGPDFFKDLFDMRDELRAAYSSVGGVFDPQDVRWAPIMYTLVANRLQLKITKKEK